MLKKQNDSQNIGNLADLYGYQMSIAIRLLNIDLSCNQMVPVSDLQYSDPTLLYF
jgi:hypothetical protein